VQSMADENVYESLVGKNKGGSSCFCESTECAKMHRQYVEKLSDMYVCYIEVYLLTTMDFGVRFLF
jgi:hypothetical protein